MKPTAKKYVLHVVTDDCFESNIIREALTSYARWFKEYNITSHYDFIINIYDDGTIDPFLVDHPYYTGITSKSIKATDLEDYDILSYIKCILFDEVI